MPCGLQGAGKGAVEEHHARGYMLRKRGDFDSAILQYGKALEAQSNHFSALFNRGFCYDKVLAVLYKQNTIFCRIARLLTTLHALTEVLQSAPTSKK